MTKTLFLRLLKYVYSYIRRPTTNNIIIKYIFLLYVQCYHISDDYTSLLHSLQLSKKTLGEVMQDSIVIGEDTENNFGGSAG